MMQDTRYDPVAEGATGYVPSDMGPFFNSSIQ